MDEPFGVDVLKARDELIRKHKHRLERDLPAAIVEEVLQIWPENLEHYHPVFAFVSMPVYSRDADPTGKFFIDFDFIL